MTSCPPRHEPLPAISVAAPVRVHTRLAQAPDGPREVLHASASAIYVDLDGSCAGVVSATASRVPCALASQVPDLRALGTSAYVRNGALLIGGHELTIGRLVDPRARTVADGDRTPSPPTPALLDLGLDADGSLTCDDAARLVGRGPGLTPLGDDVLAGWFTTRAALGRPDHDLEVAVRARLGATTSFSATLLDCAMRGESLPQLADWLARPTETTTQALLAVGATSGAGLLAGAERALSTFARSSATSDSPGRAA